MKSREKERRTAGAHRTLPAEGQRAGSSERKEGPAPPSGRIFPRIGEKEQPARCPPKGAGRTRGREALPGKALTLSGLLQERGGVRSFIMRGISLSARRGDRLQPEEEPPGRLESCFIGKIVLNYELLQPFDLGRTYHVFDRRRPSRERKGALEKGILRVCLFEARKKEKACPVKGSSRNRPQRAKPHPFGLCKSSHRKEDCCQYRKRRGGSDHQSRVGRRQRGRNGPWTSPTTAAAGFEIRGGTTPEHLPLPALTCLSLIRKGDRDFERKGWDIPSIIRGSL